MSINPRWFDRKFDFNFPVTLHPNLRVRLRGTPARLEDATTGLSRERLTYKREGKWSIQEHAGHLLDLEPLGMTRVDEFLRGASAVTAADIRNRKTDEARHNDREVREIFSAFRSARGEFVLRLDRLEDAVFARLARHPRLDTDMRLVDLLFFIAEHDDHHLACIWEIRQ